MSELNEEELVPIIIDLGALRSNKIDESWLRMFGSSMQLILKSMFGGPPVNMRVRGSKSEVSSFAKLLGREKKYMEAFNEYGLGAQQTYRSKYSLDTAVRQFERRTGLKWPFK